MARAVRGPTGDLRGGVYATLDVAYIHEKTLNHGGFPGAAVAVLGADGVMLSRSKGQGSWIGEDARAHPAFAEAGGKAGTFVLAGADGIERLSLSTR